LTGRAVSDPGSRRESVDTRLSLIALVQPVNRGNDDSVTRTEAAIDKADGLTVRVEDPETRTAYVVIKEDLYRVRKDAVLESDFTLHEFQ
jgi:hypothetical protein